MIICIMKHFLEKVEDSEIKPIIEYALSLSQKHVQMISDIFQHENHPIPIGFNGEDVTANVPRLFSYTFMVMYLEHMGIIGMAASGIAVGPPYIPTRNKVDVVKKQSFLTGFFGERRPPHVIEISHLFANVLTNSFGKALITGFGQVANRRRFACPSMMGFTCYGFNSCSFFRNSLRTSCSRNRCIG
jgi:hypothetical protein